MNDSLIPFEVHITVGELSKLQSGSFETICREQEGKPLFIELACGKFRNQPMFSKVVREKDLKSAVRLSEQYSLKLREAGFVPNRFKIEVPLEYVTHFDETGSHAKERYYEWHGKIPYERVELLLQLCEAHHVHLSRNALKDEQELRFITLREFGSLNEFQQRVKALHEGLQREERPVSKQHFEYCVFDTNEFLDTGWLIP